MQPRILLDEGLSRLAAHFLRQNGYDAIHLADIDMLSSDDAQILVFAMAEDRTVVTLDHDFHQLLALNSATSPA